MRIENNKTIITDNQNNDFVYVHFIGEGTHNLIPYVDVEGRSKKYWVHHFIPKETWLLIDKDFNFDNYSITKDDFQTLVNEGKESYREILEKYHNSF